MVSVTLEVLLMDAGQKSDYQPSLPERYDLSDEDIYEAMKGFPGIWILRPAISSNFIRLSAGNVMPGAFSFLQCRSVR